MPTKILIVDDHARFRQVLIEFLHVSLPAVEFLQAADAEDGIHLAHKASPALVIMDVFLRDMNGIDATRQIKNALPALPVIILSFHDDTVYRFAASQAGAAAFVSKDYLTTLLPLTIKDILQLRPNQPKTLKVSNADQDLYQPRHLS